MRKSTTATQFIQEIAVLLDKGAVKTMQEVRVQIQNKNIIDWLEEEYQIDIFKADFSLFEQKHRDYIHEFFYSQWEGYAGNESRKWGIENNGLILLISWATELIRRDFNKDDFL